jgi:RES domain-containing protein
MSHRVNAHPDFAQLFRRIAALMTHAVSLERVVFRCSDPMYAIEHDLLTGEGSRQFGGRWNPPSSFATVYAAYSDETALAEAKANHLYYGLDPADALPRTIVAVDARLSKVIDLTDGTARRLLGVSATRMRGDDWRKLNRSGAESLTQAIGRAGYESGAEGLIVPACDGGKNLVWFPGNLLSTSKAVIRNADKLE